jgi:midasin
MQSGMSEAEREKLETERLGEICGADCNIEHGHDIHGNPKIVDGWMLPAVELKRVVDARNDIISEERDYYTMDLDDANQLCQSDLRQAFF